MKKFNIHINHGNQTITVSKSFYNKASKYGTAEYKALNNAIKQNRGYEVVFKTSDKKSYRGLTFKRMEAYILSQPNSEDNLIAYSKAKEVAEAKGSKYPLTKKWFLETFPSYKLSEVSADEMKTIQNISADNTNFTQEVAA